MFETWLQGVDGPRVVLIQPAHSLGLEAFIRARFPGSTVVRLSPGLGDEALHLALAASGPNHLVVDTSRGSGAPDRLSHLLLHTQQGGALLAGLGDLADAPSEQRAQFRAEVHDLLGDSLAASRIWPRFIALRNGTGARAVIRERQTVAFLKRAPHVGRVLLTLPGSHVESEARLTQSDADHPQEFRTEWSVPPLVLREYFDCVSSPGQLLDHGSALLPGSIRPLTGRRKNEWTVPIGNLFVQREYITPRNATPRQPDVPRREGTYFHLDNEFRGHFGHTMTDVISKTWGWEQARTRYPGIRALVHGNRRAEPASWELELLAACGIPARDVVYEPGPVLVDRLVVAAPMFAQPRYVHPELKTIWRRTGDSLLEGVPDAESPSRIFVARSIANRPCRNADEVEAFFERSGFTLVYPEKHSLPEQVRMFRQADVVAGYAGSGMFGLLWAEEPKEVILITSESYSARNEWLIAGLVGHQVHVAWCRSEAEWSDGRWQPGAFQAGFHFDFEREGAFVKEVVAGLGGARSGSRTG
ncbi:glycosyltransferase family 61 protein [Nocardioides insulae]|uniref:glycosyltransferase family 61 protein n=1 Tax=Nocardioides insulae TaxID=394734 RepID=UPI00040307D9|nr:glycosyltransferase 61 family protein [Nocardioides insulae]